MGEAKHTAIGSHMGIEMGIKQMMSTFFVCDLNDS